MKNSKTSNIKLIDISLFIGIAIVTIAAFFCTYYFSFSTPVEIIIWIAWSLLCASMVYYTAIGKRVVAFANEAKIELFKVVWPTRQETIHTTSIVMIMVAATGFILWGIDTLMIWAIAKITHLG